MVRPIKVGVLAFHGDVSEHVRATTMAAAELQRDVQVSLIRTKSAAEHLDALIIPGGESTTLYKLCVREDMIGTLQNIPAVFGTCAGAIMLAKRITNAADGQASLGLMDIAVTRNAYGRQDHSFEAELDTPFGTVSAAFIRAPRIDQIAKDITVLATHDDDVVACEQRTTERYYLALTCHPELTTTAFHQHFLRNVPV